MRNVPPGIQAMPVKSLDARGEKGAVRGSEGDCVVCPAITGDRVSTAKRAPYQAKPRILMSVCPRMHWAGQLLRLRERDKRCAVSEFSGRPRGGQARFQVDRSPAASLPRDNL